MSEIYQADHVTFDRHEMPVTLHCLRCHAVIARRDEMPGRDPGTSVHAIVKAPNYREVYAELSDGSVCYFPMCQDCIRQPVDGAAALEVVKRGWELSLIHARRPPEAIENQRLKVANLSVVKPTISISNLEDNNLEDNIEPPPIPEKIKTRTKLKIKVKSSQRRGKKGRAH